MDNNILYLLQPWYKAIAIFVGFTLFRFLYKSFARSLLHRVTNILNLFLAEDLLNDFEKPFNCMLWIWNFSLAIGASPLNSTAIGEFLSHVMRTSLVFCFFWGVYNATSMEYVASDGSKRQTAFRWLRKRLKLENEPTVSGLLSTMLHCLSIFLGFAMICKEWNYDISGFLASLSIGSVAVAFAAKDTLANVFGSVIILLDKPFRVGDWISVNGTEGIVEQISFRATCVRAFPNELVYIPNNLLSNVHITNFTKREKSRIDMTLGFPYDTNREKMEELIRSIRAFLDSRAYLIKENTEVNFANYGESSMNVRIIAYTPVPVGPQYRACMSDMNLGLLDVMKDVKITCAFPSTSVYFATPLQTNVVEKK